jgi:hypothetical protein
MFIESEQKNIDCCIGFSNSWRHLPYILSKEMQAHGIGVCVCVCPNQLTDFHEEWYKQHATETILRSFFSILCYTYQHDSERTPELRATL